MSYVTWNAEGLPDWPWQGNVSKWFIDCHLEAGGSERPALVTDRGEVTYGRLAAEVNRAGRALLDLGLVSGDRLLMSVLDVPEFISLFWGAIRIGVLPVPVNTLLRTADFRFLMEDSGARVVAYSAELAAEVEPALAAAPGRPAGLALGRAGDPPPWQGANDDFLAAATVEPTDPAFWLYSSGSTGRPKAAIHGPLDLVVTSQRYGAETLGLSPLDRCYSAAKLFFAYGLGNAMSFPLWSGGCAILSAARPTPEETFRIIARYRPTVFFGVPTLYAAQLQALESATPDLSSLRCCVSAGEALPAGLFERWREATGLEILDGIGSTEALHIFISNRPGEAKAGVSGKPVPGYEARILDDAGREVEPSASGRLWVRGSSVMSGYWQRPEKTAAALVGGWLDTGDTYRRDVEGHYVYEGRSDDMIKVGGIWCSPFEIESVLQAHPAVVEAAVAGRPDPEGLVKPEAWLILAEGQEGGPELEAQLLGDCKASLAPYKYPRRFHFVPDLPRTATGKIQRFRLRQGWEPGSEGSLEG